MYLLATSESSILYYKNLYQGSSVTNWQLQVKKSSSQATWLLYIGITICTNYTDCDRYIPVDVLATPFDWCTKVHHVVCLAANLNLALQKFLSRRLSFRPKSSSSLLFSYHKSMKNLKKFKIFLEVVKCLDKLGGAWSPKRFGFNYIINKHIIIH